MNTDRLLRILYELFSADFFPVIFLGMFFVAFGVILARYPREVYLYEAEQMRRNPWHRWGIFRPAHSYSTEESAVRAWATFYRIFGVVLALIGVSLGAFFMVGSLQRVSKALNGVPAGVEQRTPHRGAIQR